VKVPVADGDIADVAVVAARTSRDGGERSVSLFLVDLSGPGVARVPVKTVDPTRSHARIELRDVPAEPLGATGDGWRLLERLLDRAAVLFAFEQVGGAQAALEMGRDYALGRFAFGRPIGSFQAIKHKLADVYIATELARSNAYYGAWALSTDAPELPVAAAAARVSASEAFYLAAKENIQTHGGMGFTWEFDCHLYYRRAKLLALALGSTRVWKDRLITRLESRASA
jgi:alkylation response protein AidB-like acyl-CoA dehydrogenase